MAERENKKRLTKEELHAENEQIRKDLRRRDASSKEDQERIVNSLRPKNLLYYAIVLLFPIVGVPLIWFKQKELKINNASVYLWVAIGVIVFIQHVRLLIAYFS